jgi:hypothetical protein
MKGWTHFLGFQWLSIKFPADSNLVVIFYFRNDAWRSTSHWVLNDCGFHLLKMVCYKQKANFYCTREFTLFKRSEREVWLSLTAVWNFSLTHLQFIMQHVSSQGWEFDLKGWRTKAETWREQKNFRKSFEFQRNETWSYYDVYPTPNFKWAYWNVVSVVKTLMWSIFVSHGRWKGEKCVYERKF